MTTEHQEESRLLRINTHRLRVILPRVSLTLLLVSRMFKEDVMFVHDKVLDDICENEARVFEGED